MARKLKRPDGAVYEEFIAFGSHDFLDGKYVGCVHDLLDGHYSGRFFYQYPDGKQTPWYTSGSAPAWLLAMYREAINPDNRRGSEFE